MFIIIIMAAVLQFIPTTQGTQVTGVTPVVAVCGSTSDVILRVDNRISF